MTWKFFDFGNVMVPIINKYGYATKNICFYLFCDTFHQIVTQQNLETFGIVIQMFCHGYGSTKPVISFVNSYLITSIITIQVELNAT